MRGASVNRKNYTSPEALAAKAEEKIERDKRAGKKRDNFYRAVFVKCADIRGIVGDDGDRLYYVYDTALADDQSHADICQSDIPSVGSNNEKKSQQPRIGSKLIEAFNLVAIEYSEIVSE